MKTPSALHVAVGTDHGGYLWKPTLIRLLKGWGYTPVDMGTHSPRPCDYPAIGAKVAQAVSSGAAQRGLLLCKSGGGMAIVANKFPRVRAVVASTVSLAKHAREHNDSNVLVLGAEHLSLKRAQGILRVWLSTDFSGGRHARRVNQIVRMERRLFRRVG